MAVGMLLSGEGITRDVYVAVSEKMFGNYPMRDDQAPEGVIVHTAGETADGFYIYDIWESQEQFLQYMESTIGPAMAGIVDPDAPQPQPQFFPIETIVKGSALLPA